MGVQGEAGEGEDKITAMSNYYVLDCYSPLEAEHYRIDVPYSAKGLRWKEGVLFTDDDERRGFHPPVQPIEIQTELETEPPPRIYAELYWTPIPLMSRRLVAAFSAAGVNNLQMFETRLLTIHGQNAPSADHYVAVNIVGLVAAADLGQSKISPEVGETLISMDFHSLSVDETMAKNLLMFRLAENITAVLVHERVKAAVESAGIRSLTWFRPEEWAG